MNKNFCHHLFALYINKYLKVCFFLQQESKKYLVDGYQLLKYEPKVLPEGKIAQHAEQNLHEINKLLKRFNVT